MSWWSGLSAATQGGLISAGGSLLSGLLTQRSANRQMQAQADSSRDQYQRAMLDMKRAGLNPMLAAKLGGNAPISGAMASFPDLGSAYLRGQQGSLAMEQSGLSSAQRAKTVEETKNVPLQGDLLRAQKEVANATVQEKKQAVYNMQSDVLRIGEETRRLMAVTDSEKQRVKLIELQQETEKFIAAFKKADAEHKEVTAFYYKQLKQDGVLYEAMLPKLNYLLVKGGQIVQYGKKALGYSIDEMSVSP